MVLNVKNRLKETTQLCQDFQVQRFLASFYGPIFVLSNKQVYS